MRLNHLTATALLALVLPAAAIAQTHGFETGFPDTVSYQQVEMRQSLNFEYKLPAGFDMGLEEELREVLWDPTSQQTAYFSKSYTTISFGYKLLSHQSLRSGYKYGMKLDLGYTLKFNNGSLMKAHEKGITGGAAASECLQHRPFAELTGSADFGNWKLTLKETYRVTFRTDSVGVTDKWNEQVTVNEKNPCLMELKTRLKADYSIPGKPVKLFAWGEASATLNEQTCPWTDAEGRPLYGGQYLRGTKASVGVRWRIDKHNALSLSYLYHYQNERDLNITGKNSSKRQNVELLMERSHTHAIVLSYDLGY